MDDHFITPVCEESGARDSAVYCDDRAIVVSVWLDVQVVDV